MEPSQLTSDKLTIILDPYHDHLTRAVFEVNPVGVFGDALGEGGSNLDPSWDPVWEEATRIDSLGWTAEIRIPLSQLRFAPHDSAQTGVSRFFAASTASTSATSGRSPARTRTIVPRPTGT